MNLTKLLNRYSLIFLLIFVTVFCFAQEVKVPLQTNVVIQNYLKQHPATHNSSKHIQSALILPFFDDFSSSYVYPNPALWKDSCVFVNDDFAVNPPTVGVASFDGIDRNGIPYQNSNSAYIADTLTSQPIDLSLLTHDSTIYLSFFYQAAGRCNPPDQGDSLILQFLNKDSVWVTVWEADGNSAPSKFKQVFVHVYDSLFINNGITIDTLVDTFRTSYFQFRFLNLVSGYGMIDIWNLDYVLLDKNRSRSDTTMLDEAFVYRGPSLLKNYSQMPWTHYKADSINQMGTQYPITIRNNDINSHFLFFHSLIYQYGNATPIYQFPSSGGYGFPINPDTNTSLMLQVATGIPSAFTFPSQSGTFAEFPVTHYIENTGGDNVYSNDTIKNVQRFADYYAYDDGTAEYAWGLANAPGGEMAMKFTTTKDDTLQGAYYFFAQMVEEVSLHLFSLAVWKDNGGIPGTLIYQKIDQRPLYERGMDAFHYYKFDSSIVSNNTPLFLTAGTYYVGWIQLDGTSLNIGLDENSNWDSTKLFFNTNNVWEPSSIYGTVMIRPVFGGAATVGIKNNDNLLAASLDIFPNPASSKINLKWTNTGHFQGNDLLIQIYDLEGRIVLEQKGYQKEIDITNINEGFYFAKISDSKSGVSFTQKLIINR